MEDLEEYVIQWLWTSRKGSGSSWWVISHAAKDGEDKTPCGLDTTTGWWDGSGQNLNEGRPSCKKCIKALAKRGIVARGLHGTSGMVVEKTT